MSQETEYEVVKTSRGYVMLAWEGTGNDATLTAANCSKPELLLNGLLKGYESLLEFDATQAERDLTSEEKSVIKEKLRALRDKCKESD